MRWYFILAIVASHLACHNENDASSIKVVGQMRDVMWKGDLSGKISTDSLGNPKAYGLGPIEYLKGEVLLFEGQTFIANVMDSLTHQVTTTKSVKAPFFVYTSASDLKEIPIAAETLSLSSTEQLIDSLYFDYDEPVLVRIDGAFQDITIHSVNLPDGSSVSSPAEAHEGLTQYRYQNIRGSIIGFFSRHHQAIFTHHDSYFHAHFISEDRSIMGHLDAVNFNPNQASFKISK